MRLILGVEVGEPFHPRSPKLLMGERVRHGVLFVWHHRDCQRAALLSSSHLFPQTAHLVATPDKGQFSDVRDERDGTLVREQEGMCVKKKKRGSESAVKY